MLAEMRMSSRGEVSFWPEMRGQTLSESIGGRLDWAARWSVGSTPASSENVRYLWGGGRDLRASTSQEAARDRSGIPSSRFT